MTTSTSRAAAPLEAIIFDVDGTLAETEEAHRTAFNEAFIKFDLNWTWNQDDYRHLLKTTGGKERILAHMSDIGYEHTGSQPLADFIAQLHAHKTGLYTMIIDSGTVALRPGIAQLIEEADAKQMRMAIATTTSQPNVVALVKATLGKNGMDLFEVISSGDMVQHKKPAPDIFLRALDGLGLSAGNCLALEDSFNGLASARGANIATLITPSIYTNQDDFSGAALIIPTIADLAAGHGGSALVGLVACHEASQAC